MQTSLLQYDIPNTGRNGTPCFPNPSPRLRSRALRTNLSVWIVDKKRVPWRLLNEMTEAGVEWHLFDFSEAATPAILELAAKHMRKELDEATQRERESLERFDNEYQAVVEDENSTARQVEDARKKHEKMRKAVLKRSETLVKDLETAAKYFKLDMSNLPFDQTRRRVQGIRALNGARASLYFEAAQQAQGSMGEAARTDEGVHPEILADYLEDQGEDVSAIRTAFVDGATTQGEATAAPNDGAPVEVSSSSTTQEPQRIQSRGRRAGTRQRQEAPRQEVRTFTVQNSRMGRRTVQSSLTDDEARHICRTLGNRFMRQMANREHISDNQRSWLHVMAHELEEQERNNAQGQAEMTPAPAPQQSAARTTEAPQLPVIQNGTVISEISTQAMRWDAKTATLSAEHSDLGSPPLTRRINVRSHRTGVVREFTKQGEQYDNEGDLQLTRYRHDDGTALVIIND